ncbi:ATP-dependent zinc metalloprotease FtsH [uncultured Slackia sp.]|uniref:ATP-dependent zinc metalloprotease FtsH n=1 Tax=uncultured Slackia sp. TaxID=665903 RepID=UPI0026E00C97|nr:ATP-dependent zinc metalloprotease FtsH [uncultured Slackia sp.]
MPKPPQRISVISAILLLLVAFFVGSQMLSMMNAKETDALITSEFVQAVEQDRVVDVVYDAGEYTVTGTYYPAATAGSTAGDAYNSAFEALDAKAESVIGTGAPQVSTTEIDEQTIGTERKYTSTYVGQDSLMQLLSEHPDIQYQVKLPDSFFQALISLLPMLLLAGLMIFFFVQMNKANNSQMSFGKAKAKKTSEERPDVRFDDVAGEDEAVEELQEIKDFLVNPEKYRTLGAKIPRGCLLVGPPGTGKTLLARAVAGEANVPFFSISGSEFVEMFVGVGASRVRSLFEQAKESAPSIIFIDEIDAVGRQRGTGLGGGHDEREQTLNQLLVEMDGFEKNDAVVLIAATNRVDVLDPALLRPGRFDRQIVVDAPDVRGREKILEVHAKNKPIGPDVDLPRIAKLTSGMTGADLMNLMNEAALLTARRNKPQIGMAEVNESMERLMAGPERKNRVMNEKTRRIIAYHESGHALVGHLLPNADPVHKITIVPRGMALGYTMSIPDEDKFLVSRNEMYDDLAVFMGGRVAEEIFCGDITTGASNDLERATKQARKMVTSYGMSDALGQQTFGQPNHEVFLGRDMGNTQDYSPETAQRIDEEVARLMKQAHDLAYMILSERQEQMHLMASVLLERETVDGEACEALLNNEWDVYLEREKEAKKADTRAKAKALLVAPSTMPASGDVVISGDLPKDPAGADDASRDMVSFDNPTAASRQREAVSFTDPAACDIPMPAAGHETTDDFSKERKDHS